MLMGLPDRWDACSRTISLQGKPSSFAYRGDTIAVGLGSSVELLDAVTGVGTSALRGSTSTVLSVTFSLDGTLLVSRSKDKTIRLWDIQTGGVIRTFSDRTCLISATSISPDNTTIALGTSDGSIRLWDVRTGKCHPITRGQGGKVNVVSFLPSNSKRLISSLWNGEVQQMEVNGHEIEPSWHDDEAVVDLAYALDGTRFVSCGRRHVRVRDSKDGGGFYWLAEEVLSRCCFSPDGRFVACSGNTTIYVWDATIPGVPLVERLVGHSLPITFLAFSSSLVSGSSDQSVKFWQSSNFLAKSTPTLRGSAPIRSVKFFTEDSTIVTSDASGVVKTWDLFTGTCKSTFSTPAEGPCDTHLEGDTLIIVWHTNDQGQYHIWDVYGHRSLRSFYTYSHDIDHLKVSGDGSNIFGLGDDHIEVVSLQTGDARGVYFEPREAFGFFVCGSKVGIGHSRGMGWDFGGPEVPDFGEFPDRPRLDLVNRFTGDTSVGPRWIQDTVTKRLVFRLPERCTRSGTQVEWDGRYLLVWDQLGEVVIMDFDPVRCALDNIR